MRWDFSLTAFKWLHIHFVNTFSIFGQKRNFGTMRMTKMKKQLFCIKRLFPVKHSSFLWNQETHVHFGSKIEWKAPNNNKLCHKHLSKHYFFRLCLWIIWLRKKVIRRLRLVGFSNDYTAWALNSDILSTEVPLCMVKVPFRIWMTPCKCPHSMAAAKVSWA